MTLGYDAGRGQESEQLRKLTERGFVQVEGLRNHLTDGAVIVEVDVNGEVVNMLFDVTSIVILDSEKKVYFEIAKTPTDIKYTKYKEVTFPITVEAKGLSKLLGRKETKIVKNTTKQDIFLPSKQVADIEVTTGEVSDNKIPERTAHLSEQLTEIGFIVVRNSKGFIASGSIGEGERVLVQILSDNQTVEAIYHSMSTIDRDIHATLDAHIQAREHRFPLNTIEFRALSQEDAYEELGIQPFTEEEKKAFAEQRAEILAMSNDEADSRYKIKYDASNRQSIRKDENLPELVQTGIAESGELNPEELAEPLRYAEAALLKGYGSFVWKGEQYFVSWAPEGRNQRTSALINTESRSNGAMIITTIREGKKISLRAHTILTQTIPLGFFESPNSKLSDEYRKIHEQDRYQDAITIFGWPTEWLTYPFSNQHHVPAKAIKGFFQLMK